MTREEWKAEFDRIMQKQYGIGINDTEMCDDDAVDLAMAYNESPQDTVNDIASERDLYRIDNRSMWQGG